MIKYKGRGECIFSLFLWIKTHPLKLAKSITSGRVYYFQERKSFYATGNSVGIPYCIKKLYLAGLHCGGKADAAEATRRRRRILQAGFFFFIRNFCVS